MGLRDWLNSGRMVAGSPFDTKVKPLSAMDVAAQQRQGYADKNGNWTDRGFDRATTADYQKLEQSRRAQLRAKR